jgi:predicted DNA-binding WGR domain protein
LLSNSDASNTSKQRYELSEGKSNKFWEIELTGSSHAVTYGRIGTNGQSQTKEFASEDEAKKSHDKLIAEKVKKGYQLVSSAGATPTTTSSPPKAAAKKTAPVSEPVPAKAN